MRRRRIETAHSEHRALNTFTVTLAILGFASACSDQIEVMPRQQPASLSADREVLDLALRSDLEISRGAGWALGKPRSVAEADGGHIFVLDSDWKRVSVHSPTNADLVRTIGNGYGTAPGQFALPVDLALQDGVARVLDYQIQRVSEYAVDGPFIRDVMVTGAEVRTLDRSRGVYWFKLMHAKQGRILAIADSAGRLRSFVGALDEHEMAMLDGGNAGVLAASGQDEMMYLNADASRLEWYRDTILSRTLSIFARTSLVERASDGRKMPWLIPRRAAVGMASLGDSLIAVVTGRLARELETADSRPEKVYFLSVFDMSGRRRALLEITAHGMPIAVNVGQHSGSIYVSFTSTSQGKVVRYRVQSARTVSMASGR